MRRTRFETLTRTRPAHPGPLLALLWAACLTAALLLLTSGCAPAERPVVDEEPLTEDVADMVPAEPPELQVLGEHPEVYRLLHGDPTAVLLEATLEAGEEARLPDTDGMWAVMLEPGSALETDTGALLEGGEDATVTRVPDDATSIRAGGKGVQVLILARTQVEIADAAVDMSPERFLEQVTGDGARTLFTSDELVVLETTLAPGDELTAVPYERLLYTRSGGTVEIETATGEARRRELVAGEVLQRDPSDLQLVNTGGSEIDAILFWLLPADDVLDVDEETA